MLRAKNGFSGSDGENEPVSERRKVKSCLDAVVIRVYDEAGNETHEHKGDFKEPQPSLVTVSGSSRNASIGCHAGIRNRRGGGVPLPGALHLV